MRIINTQVILSAFFLIFSVACSTDQNKDACPDFIKTEEKKDKTAIIRKSEAGILSKNHLTPKSRLRNKQPVVTSLDNETGNQQAILIEESLYDQWDKKPQVFILYHPKDTTLICEQGTRITIPEGSLTFMNGKPAKYPIRIEVKEYYRMEDFLLANLTTSSDGRMLESGGMLHIEALSGKQKLKVKNKETLKIEMPTSIKKSEMELFYGNHENNQINWKPASRRLNSRPRTSTPTLYITYSSADFVNPTAGIIRNKWQRGESALDKLSDTVSVEFDMDKHGTISNIKTYKGKTELTKASVNFNKWRRVFGLNWGWHWRSVLYTRNKINYGTDLGIEVRGIREGKSNGLLLSSVSLELGKTELQKIRMRAKNGPVRVRVTKAYVHVNKKMRDQVMEKELEKMKKEGTLENNQEAMNYYIFDLNNLGWINCDRFYEIPEDQKIAYKVNSQGAKDVKIIFNDIQSIMTGSTNGSNTCFYDVPVNTSVTIVAIRKVEGGFELGSKKTLISDRMENLEFEKVASADALKEKIKTLIQ